jgi:uncharacterized protein
VHIGVLTLRFHLEGCASLKEKRQRLSGLRDRFGQRTHIAVCESALQDVIQSAQWSFVIVSATRALVDQTTAEVERYIGEHLDVRVSGREMEYA